MASKTILFVLLSVTLTLANPENVYKARVTKENAQLLQIITFSNNPLEVRFAWDSLLGRVLLAVDKGKRQALKAAGNNELLIKAIKNEWNDISEISINNMYELKEILENLRNSKATVKAVDEVKKFSEEGGKLWGRFNDAAARGDPQKLRNIINFILKYFRDYNNAIKQIVLYRH